MKGFGVWEGSVDEVVGGAGIGAAGPVGWKLDLARASSRNGLSWQAQRRRRGRLGLICSLLFIAHRDLAGWRRCVETAHFILVVDLDGLAERSDLYHRHSISDEPDESNGLRNVAVNPLFIVAAIGISTLLFAHLVFGCAQRSEHHPVVHSNEDLVGRDGFFQRWRKCVGVGLFR